MKRIALLCIPVLALFTVWVSAASIYSTYLPIVIRAPSTPTPTQEPTQPPPTPTQEPTQPPPTGVQILPNHSYYVDSIDYLNVVGEIMNNTDDNLRYVKITANFFSASGHLLDTDFTYTWMDTLPARDKTCFDVSVPVPSGWSYYQFEAPTYWTDGQPLPILTVINDSGSYDPTFGWYEIIGQVRNDNGSRVEYVSPIGTIYNASGKVIGCDFTYVNSTDLNPGQISSFEMTFVGRDYADVISYRLQVDGDP
jgi:hypothetical protein